MSSLRSSLWTLRPFVRHVLNAFRERTLTASQAAKQFGVSRSRLYVLYSAYLDACAHSKGPVWAPTSSGGDHSTAWPEPVVDLLIKRLDCSLPCPYSFVASEALRLHNFKLDRAQVRHWRVAKRPCSSHTHSQASGSHPPLATISNRGALATRCLPTSLVPALLLRLSHAQYAR